MPARSRKNPEKKEITPVTTSPVSFDFDQLFAQAEVEEPAKASRLDHDQIPAAVHQYVAKAYETGLRYFLPVGSKDQYLELRRLLQSAGDYHEPKLTAQIAAIGHDGKVIVGEKTVNGDKTTVTAPDLTGVAKLRFTVGERRGRKVNSKDEIAGE